MLYEEYETDITRSALAGVVSALPAPVCLLGGWAVYYTVNTGCRASTGASYHGSKDIDLGFHLEEGATGEALRGSALARAVESLTGMGFRSIGVRLFKEYHRETLAVLSEEDAKRTPSYNIFHLYVDLLVDNAPGGVKRAVGVTPFDEKMLAHVFEGGMYRTIDEFPTRVIVPSPPLLLAMKTLSLPGRTRDHKKHKDIMDMYALIWHSGVPVKSLRRGVLGLVPAGGAAKALSAIGGPDYEAAADALRVSREEVEGVVGGFLRSATAAEERGGRRRARPAGVSHGGLAAIVKALHAAGADKGEVEAAALCGAAGAGRDAVADGLRFLEGIGVVDMAGRGRCSLTAAGAPYAKAHFDGDADRIMLLTRGIIGRSHLAGLAGEAGAEGGAARDDLCRRIKALGGYPGGGGRGAGGMHAPAAAGAGAVLRLFEDAGLLKGAARAPAARGGGAAPNRAGGDAGEEGREHSSGAAPPPAAGGESGDLGVLAVRGVGEVRVNDLETLEVAEMYMDMLRRRLRGPPPGKAAHGDGERRRPEGAQRGAGT